MGWIRVWALLFACLLAVPPQPAIALCKEPCDPPMCSGEPTWGGASTTLEPCCEKNETFLYDECWNVVAYSCEIVQWCEECELTCN